MRQRVILAAFLVLFIFCAGSVNAGVKGIRFVDDTAEKFSREVDRILKKFQSIDERVARSYLRDIELLVSKYEREMAEFHIKPLELYGKNMTPIFLLRVVEKIKPYPSENADQKAIMEEEGFRALLNLYASKRAVPAGDARNELKNALFEMFELDRGVWGDEKKVAFDRTIKEILGYSLLMSE